MEEFSLICDIRGLGPIEVSDYFEEECHSNMIKENLNISRIMVHARQLEEAGVKRNSRDSKRSKSFDGGSSKVRFDIKEKRRFNKRLYNRVPSKLSRTHDDKVQKPGAQKGRSGNSHNEMPTCP